ncbi:MAG: imidazole glycerol phosphate synthase subunit HisH [Oscillospiraceae bacterium]|nr:imidazole glycerol phosphate synthase subunit HisH [Oscillospiraceae bacterium]
MIKIIDYKAGNAPSVMHALSHLGKQAEFVRCVSDLTSASHIILPGVGSAKATMDSLFEMDVLAALKELVLVKKTPFLGICVGMQILFEHSEEENTQCLGWLKGQVVKFDTDKVRVPQIGWNKVTFNDDTTQEDYFYFVNSYYAKSAFAEDIWGVADYNGEFTAAVNRSNIYGMQFHAEKSGEAGLELLQNFIASGDN